MQTFAIVTFGCQMNQHDSERIVEALLGAGYEERHRPEEADLILLNTCSVREKAEQKLRSEVGRLALLKRARPGLRLAVAGCVAQQEGQKLLRRMPELDLVLGPDKIVELPLALQALEARSRPEVRTGFDLDGTRFLSASPGLKPTKVSAFVTVMKGCNERCSFCIVPHTRGPERYRPSSEIVGEIQRLVDAGSREVTLLGQTVNSYRDPEGALPAAPGRGERLFRHTPLSRLKEDESEFAALLRRIVEAVPGLVRLRYTSPHPRHLTPSLIRAHEELAPLVRHVHLPVQSGSDRVLRRMIRRYSVNEYRERVEVLRQRVPGVTLSTDVIVGFSGETETDFQATLGLVDEIGFSGLFGFKYSVRPYTPAQKLEDDVPEAEKSRRLALLFQLSEAQRRRHLESLVGTDQEVLLEGPGRGTDLTGRTSHNEIVHVGAGGDVAAGRLLSVRIEEAFKNSLRGRASDTPGSAAAARPPSNARRSLPVLG